MSIPRPVTSVNAIKVRPGNQVRFPEHVVTEEPLEIRVAGPGQESTPLVVTMRTPGHDFDLAAGFVLTEGIARTGEIAAVGYCEAVSEDPQRRYNTVTVGLTFGWDRSREARRFAATASCGVCGKSSIDDIAVACPAVPAAAPVAASVVRSLPDKLRESQKAFDRTGGLHAAGLFDRCGEMVCCREDVGRHNAVDKVVGHVAMGGRPMRELSGAVLMVSGRVSFEIVQKAAVAGIGSVCAVSAPSSLAVQAAERFGMGLAGFVRRGTFNVYSHPERFTLDA
jgi:FdhD protein